MLCHLDISSAFLYIGHSHFVWWLFSEVLTDDFQGHVSMGLNIRSQKNGKAVIIKQETPPSFNFNLFCFTD